MPTPPVPSTPTDERTRIAELTRATATASPLADPVTEPTLREGALA